ncbi:MAG: glycosyltransferase [Gammaproteobacteria bacterium]|nr:glycosyltransferase [Gammaproteobacteria bacterium]
MASAPLISIVLSTYDRLQYLPETIASVLAQTWEDWELIIADDGSAMETRNYLSGLLRMPKIRVLWLPHSGRPAVARNAALRCARGEYIAFLDSDDTWLPEKLERQITSLRAQPECLWNQTSFVLTDAAGSPVKGMPAAGGWILERLIRADTVIALPSVLASRALIEEVKGFDETLTTCEDYELWIRCAARSPIDAIAEPLTLVRRHQEHYMKPIGALHDTIRVVDRMLDARLAGNAESYVRKRRAELWAQLARAYAIQGQHAAAFAALSISAPFSCRYLIWWRGALAVAGWTLAPAAVRKGVRRCRGILRSRRARSHGSMSRRKAPGREEFIRRDSMAK